MENNIQIHTKLEENVQIHTKLENNIQIHTKLGENYDDIHIFTTIIAHRSTQHNFKTVAYLTNIPQWQRDSA